MPDWKRVASERLKEIRLLRRRLKQDRAKVADAVVEVVQQEIHARCLTSISGDEWGRAFEAMKKKIQEQI